MPRHVARSHRTLVKPHTYKIGISHWPLVSQGARKPSFFFTTIQQSLFARLSTLCSALRHPRSYLVDYCGHSTADSDDAKCFCSTTTLITFMSRFVDTHLVRSKSAKGVDPLYR